MKSVWPWIAGLLVGLPVLYVASFGPACWLTSRLDRGAGRVSAELRAGVLDHESHESRGGIAACRLLANDNRRVA